MRGRRGFRGFTLVELLVVIMVTGVLLAMLAPSLANGRRMALAVKCGANQRALGMAMAGYNEEWKQAYPYHGNLQKDGWPTWLTLMGPYLGNVTKYAYGAAPKALECPATPFDTRKYQAGDPNPSNYGYGRWFLRWPSTDGDSPVFIPNNAYGVLQHAQDARRVWQVGRPSELLLAGEVVNNANYLTRVVDPVFFTSSSATYWTEDKWALGWWNNTVMTIHFGAWNSLYADGHVTRDSKAVLMKKTNRFWWNTD